jgi:hypothetical protein
MRPRERPNQPTLPTTPETATPSPSPERPEVPQMESSGSVFDFSEKPKASPPPVVPRAMPPNMPPPLPWIAMSQPVAPPRVEPEIVSPENTTPSPTERIVREPETDDFIGRLRRTAGPIVRDTKVVPLQSDVVSIVRPIAPSQAFAIIRSGREDVVEVWNGMPPKRIGQVKSRSETFNRPNYALSTDGQRLLRIATFPKLSAREVSVADGKELNFVELGAPLSTPVLLGYLSADRFLIRWEQGPTHGLEVWDLKTKRHGRQIVLTTHDPSPGNEGISPDGKLFASVTKGQLMLYGLTEGGQPRRLPIKALDPRWAIIRPAGIAFSADSLKVAALFVHEGDALVVAWNVRSGKVLYDRVVPGAMEPVMPLRGGAKAPSLDWLAGGGAWLVCGTAVIDATSGQLIADLTADKVFDQGVAGDSVIHLGYKDQAGVPAGVAVVTLDAQRLPSTKPTK